MTVQGNPCQTDITLTQELLEIKKLDQPEAKRLVRRVICVCYHIEYEHPTKRMHITKNNEKHNSSSLCDK